MIRRLLLLNGLAVLAATLNHGIWEVRPALEATLQEVGRAARLSSPSFMMVQLVFLLVQVGVPAFLLVSGIFIAISTPKHAKTIPFNQVLNRVKVLVIPYLLWTLVILALLIARERRFTALELLDIFLVRGVIGPYYYVPMLVVYLLLTPFLVPLAQTQAKLLLVGSLMLLLSLPVIQYATMFTHSPALEDVLAFFRGWRWLHNFFWFVLGMVTGFHMNDLKRLLQGRKGNLTVFLLLAVVLTFLEMNLVTWWGGLVMIGPRYLFFSQVFNLCLLLTFLAWSDLNLPFETGLTQLGLMSFGIYLIHRPVQQSFNMLVERSFSGLMGIPLAWIGMLFLVGLLVPVGLYQLIKHSPAQRYSRYLFG